MIPRSIRRLFVRRPQAPPRRRYVLHPGYVISPNDGQTHYIGVDALARLYGVSLHDCVVAERGERYPRGVREQPGDVHLFPRSCGRYELPK